MIARIWHGTTTVERADDYLRFVRGRAIPEYSKVPGNIGAYVLRRIEGGQAHFLTVSFWDSMNSVREFAGDPPEKAKYYAEDNDFLLELEPNVTHYEAFDTEG